MTKTLFTMGASAMALLGAAAAFAAPGDMPGRGKPVGDLTRAQLVQKLDERFAALDTNKDGVITKDELQAARKARHDARFARLDKDGNGSISREEFDAGHDRPGKHRRGGARHGGPGGHGGFGQGMFDGNKDGKITKEEFQSRALARFDRLDTNHDGVVTADERKAAWTAMKARRAQQQPQN
jgi:Ca2+-binding EF-hand superfamily protein